MSNHAPSDEVYASHGLVDVQLDDYHPSSHDWISGTARLNWTNLPCISTPSSRVRFEWAASDLSVFKRRAQFIAIDTLPLQGGSSIIGKNGKLRESKYTTAEEIVAWWEIDSGCWLLTTERESGVSEMLIDRWEDTVEGDQKWSWACFNLVAIVDVLEALHRRGLCMLACRPHNFMMIERSGYVASFDDVTCLPTFSLSRLLGSHPLSKSNLFDHDPSEESPLNDDYVKRNLRYLSPSAAGSRRVTNESDIFTFGTLAYELVTECSTDGRHSDTPSDIDILVDIHKHLTTELIPPLVLLQRQADFGATDDELPPAALSDIIVKCLAKDADERYGGLAALRYELKRLGQICRADGNLAKFVVGEADKDSRFLLPAKPIYRDHELEILGQAWKSICQDTTASPEYFDNISSVRMINVWGLSGSGKTRLVQYWASETEKNRKGCLIAECKMDEFSQRPISSFIQIFQSLLDRTLAEPEEDPKFWIKKIRDALGQQFPVFHAVLPNDYRRLLLMGASPPAIEPIDWVNFLPSFKGWAKRLLQVFANLSRPLIFIVDDVQWMRPDELDIWKSLIEGSQPLNHVMVVSISRVQDSEPPRPSALLSTSGDPLHIKHLPEAGVVEYIESSFPKGVDGLSTLGSFLYAETSGSPLYLRSLLTSLVKESVIYFDFDLYKWRFDPLAVQAYLSDAGVDAYLSRIQATLPAESTGLLRLMACLPVSGSRPDFLADYLNISLADVEQMISRCQAVGVLVMTGQKARFSHDRQRSTAYSSIPKHEIGKRHLELANFLRQKKYVEDHLFEAADHVIAARSLRTTIPDLPATVELLLDAAVRSAFSASFVAAKTYLDAVDDIISQSGGLSDWFSHSRGLCFRYIELVSQLCGVLELFDEGLAKCDQLLAICETDLERIRIHCLRMRQSIAANRHADAMSLLWKTMIGFGYDPYSPTAHQIQFPQTAEGIDSLVIPHTVDVDPPDEDIPSVILTMLAHAGPTIFVTEPERRHHIFGLGTSLAVAKRMCHPAATYLFAVCAMSFADDVQRSMCLVSRRLADLRPASWLTSNALVVLAACSYRFKPIELVADDHTPAFDLTLALGNFELASYVFMLDIAGRRFSKRRHDIQVVMNRWQALREHLSPASKFLVHCPMQYSIALLEKSDRIPWEVQGQLLSSSDIEAIAPLPLHRAIYVTLSLRLAILFDAPFGLQQQMVDLNWGTCSAAYGTAYGSEWLFLSAVVFIRSRKQDDRLSFCRQDLESLSLRSPAFAARTEMLRHCERFPITNADNAEEVDRFLTGLEADGEHALCGLMNMLVARSFEDMGRAKFATGYYISAFSSFKSAEMPAVCHAMKKRYSFLPLPPADVKFPELNGSITLAPLLQRTATANSQETSSTVKERKDSSDPLDTLTLMRSSLALASEQDPEVLLCTLLRISCQFARADYAAIGMCDEDDKSQLRLRAAGKSGRILPHDVSVSEHEGQETCPAVYMMQVARSGRAIDRVDTGPRARLDPYYGGKTPRSLLCLPILNRGVQVGVILLSASSTASSQIESANAKEVILALATFATTTSLNYSFTQRLQREVKQRTQELSSALQAKTQFLSQCSHELRSPLSAVLGLSAVLEASPGLSPVQREHLRTIILSGEDLLGLINNILDLSRLESQSVTLEHIPFVLRDLVEGALDALAISAQKKDVEICLVSAVKTDPPELVGDGFRVKQILMNLLSNAVKFTSTGQVTVHWSHESVADNKCKITIEVQDTGIGIPSSKMGKLFKSFSQVDESTTRSFGGSGLGLVISRNLAEILGGTCTATSEYGKGSVFTFTFVADTVHETRPVEYTKFPSPKSCFILCRAGPWWDMIEENLAVLNCEPVRFAASPETCLESGERGGLNSAHKFDFVMVDTQIINKTFLDKMKSLQPKARFIYLVRSIDLAEAMTEYDISRDAIIARPIKFTSLYAAVLATHDQDIPLTVDSPKGTLRKKQVNRELAKHKPLKILLVDDNPVNVLVGRRILAMFGYDPIDSAADGQQAVEAAEKTKYNLILMDLQMPVLDGFTAMQRILASPLAGDPCVVILTADAQPEIEERCIAGGSFDHMTKPLNIPKLESILSAVYEQSVV